MYTQQTDGRDITNWALPEGATARFGRGWVCGKMAFSPDGMPLAVPTTIGCWWYDFNTMTHQALWDTEGMLNEASFSHDARWVATSTWNGDVKVWDTQTLQCVAKIGVPENRVGRVGFASDLTFSPDGHHLALSKVIARSEGGGKCCTVYDWRVNTDTPLTSFTVQPKPERRNVNPIVFSPNGNLFAYTSETNVTSVLHVETGEHIAELTDEYTDSSNEGCYKLAFSPCGQYLAACNRGNKVHVWNVHTGTFEIVPTAWTDNQQVEYGIPSWTLDSALRVAGFSSSEVMIWDATRQQTVDTFESWHPSASSACFSIDGTRFATVDRKGELLVWTEGTPPTVTPLSRHLSRGVGPVRFSKNSQALLSGHLPNNGYRLWHVAQRQVKQTYFQQYRTVVMSGDRKLLATAGEEQQVIKVWDLDSDAQVAEFLENPRGVHRLTFSPTKEYLVTARLRGVIKVWHLASGVQVAELPEPLPVDKMRFSPTGEYFVSIYRESFKVWDALRWKELRHVPLPAQRTNPHWVLRIDRNDKYFILAPRKGATSVWDIEGGEQIGPLDTTTFSDPSLYTGAPEDIRRVHARQAPPHRRILSLRFSPCGAFIVGGMWNEIRMWDATTLEPRMAIIPPVSCQHPYALAFSPCGNYFAAGMRWQDGNKKVAIRLWDTATWENIHTFWGHPTDVLEIDFSPDGTLLASSSYDGTILLWKIKPFMDF